ncbi:hypothetical protein SPRG_20012 [Saprolegnia parasitica CBS 223.65]|uniref:Cilia- and flagella-associated protein 36 n=1 Tax=Saprolegnia parasitica (strain CBS 223.65) TaxID=695850 RepID=A0A067CE96_SAPPC|nr:hypothetical protein SPRG_20012 [Saprolegnia parasitica CBS 223.65]KDO28808.1 hypothetical protein SPRG_20012 [Saprolegnia parasitica CBS 223.65]|eukprot:XP_012200540.1 hypothetical protein SPRG_20012 [Saprolegnia parasitica CBS 223.65]
MPSESKHGRDDDAKDTHKATKADDESGGAKDAAEAKGGPTIVDKVIAFFFENDEFCATFERFADKHCDIFDPDADEMQLEYTDVYNQFTKLFETKIEEFIESQGSSVAEFYDLVRKAHEKDPHGTIAIYSRMLVATSDFDVFVLMMKQTKEAQRLKK